MICDGNNDGVYYYDDSYYFDESNDENNVYIISNNFTEFLDMIVKKIKFLVCNTLHHIVMSRNKEKPIRRRAVLDRTDGIKSNHAI